MTKPSLESKNICLKRATEPRNIHQWQLKLMRKGILTTLVSLLLKKNEDIEIFNWCSFSKLHQVLLNKNNKIIKNWKYKKNKIFVISVKLGCEYQVSLIYAQYLQILIIKDHFNATSYSGYFEVT